MFLNLILASPLIALAYATAIILSLTVHEFAHAAVGKWRGDRTAEHMGRLTLNPLAHIDFLGTLMLFTVGFGWAKPVPFDPRRLQNPLLDGVVIALAGPASNLLLAVAAGMAFQWLYIGGMLSFESVLPVFLVLLILVNLMLMFFNLLPIPPLDGSHVIDAVLHKASWHKARVLFEAYGSQLLLALVIISLLTPLDPFRFITEPAFFACDLLSESSCLGVLGMYLSP
ncbi:site-2 protease family protein [bacterium]|nr:site-2 protease family protein [bacterium]